MNPVEPAPPTCRVGEPLLLALVAHDLKNAMSPILAGTRLLSEEMAGLELGEARVLASELRLQTERSYRLLEELLAWSRSKLAEEGRSDRASWARRERVELEPLVRGALLLYTLPAAARGLSLIAEIEPGAAALTDPNMLSVPLRNLVANAVRLSRPGGEVALRAWTAGEEALVEVRDAGPGLGRARLPAEGLGVAEIPRAGGMGLFLATEFVRLAGGRLEAAERPGGQGAVFTVRLPSASGDQRVSSA